MKRRVLNLLAAVSLGLGLAVAVLWGRIIWFGPIDLLRSSHFGHWIHLGMDRDGQTTLTVYRDEPNIGDVFAGYRVHGRGRFHWYTTTGLKPPNFETQVSWPTWFTLMTCSALPLWWAYGRFQRSKLDPGCCPVCGYDMRATPQRCPECGTAVGPAV